VHAERLPFSGELLLKAFAWLPRRCFAHLVHFAIGSSPSPNALSEPPPSFDEQTLTRYAATQWQTFPPPAYPARQELRQRDGGYLPGAIFLLSIP
jgi:hypothetical protein